MPGGGVRGLCQGSGDKSGGSTLTAFRLGAKELATLCVVQLCLLNSADRQEDDREMRNAERD